LDSPNGDLNCELLNFLFQNIVLNWCLNIQYQSSKTMNLGILETFCCTISKLTANLTTSSNSFASFSTLVFTSEPRKAVSQSRIVKCVELKLICHRLELYGKVSGSFTIVLVSIVKFEMLGYTKPLTIENRFTFTYDLCKLEIFWFFRLACFVYFFTGCWSAHVGK
jgi:hypothetical protein